MAVLHRTKVPVHVAGGSGPTRARWLAAWLGLAVLGVGNGVARVELYEDAVGDQVAHQISTATLMILIAGYTWLLQRRWPLTSSRLAWQVGAAWALMTLAFEFGFGHYVTGNSWSTLLADYNVFDGRLWVLIPLTILLAPPVVRRTTTRRPADRPGTGEGTR